MEAIHRQVARARRRLIMGQFFAALAWCWTAGLVIAAIALAAAKLFPLGVNGGIWAAAWIGGMLAVGIIVAAVWTWLRRRDPLFAAIEIDRRFELKERVSSVLALSPAELDSEAGQALVSDAVRRVEHADIPSRFAVPLGKKNLLPLVPAVLVFGLTFLADKSPPTEAAVTTSPQSIAQIHDSAEALRKKLAQQRKEASEKGLQDVGDLIKKVEQGIKELTTKENVDRKQAMVQLNDLSKQLEARKKALGDDNKLKQELGQMKDMKNGPAEKLADALKNGRFQKALDELKKLQDSLKDGKLDPQQQAAMAKQLDAMKDALNKMVQKNQQMQQQLQKQIDQLKNSNQLAEAKRLQKQLDQLQQQQPQMDQLNRMAQKLGQCAGSMRAGKPGEASKAMDALAQQMQDIKRAAEEQAMLSQSLEELQMCKCGMAGNCDKDGKPIRGENSAGWQPGESEKYGGDIDGAGGSGRASGKRPEKESKVKFYDSRVAQKTGEGAAVVIGEADGPNMKGKARAMIQAEVESAKHEDSDPLTGQRLPRSTRDFAKEYFDSLRDGK